MLSKAIKLAKGNEEPKIGLSVQVPKNLKDEFENICKENNVSMSSMLLSLIQVAIDESKNENRSIGTIKAELSALYASRKSIEEVMDKTGERILETTDGVVHYLERDLGGINFQIEALEVELRQALKQR